MPGDSGLLVVTTTGEHLYPILPTRLRVHWASGIPCALFQEDATRNIEPRAKNTRRDRELMFGCHRLCPAVIARLDRATQYSRDVNDYADKLRRAGSPAFAGDDNRCWCRDEIAS
jgi:hypothetical protein